MTEQMQPCFNCNRTENEIPLITWRFQGKALVVCSECMPNLIHKWHLVAETLSEAEGE